jgi:hypothetical protein
VQTGATVTVAGGYFSFLSPTSFNFKTLKYGEKDGGLGIIFLSVPTLIPIESFTTPQIFLNFSQYQMSSFLFLNHRLK